MWLLRLNSRLDRSLLCFAVVLLLAPVVQAQVRDEGTRFFESNIRPVLIKHCYECHSAESGKARGGLKVDSAEALHRGGDTGPAVVPRNLQKSLLHEVLLYGEDSYQMPPKGKLPDRVIADFRKWIQMGAPDPRATEINPDVKTEIDIEKGREFWAYQPPEMPELPPKGDWSRTDIDRFVAEQRTQNGLKPVGDADAQALIRRLYFVLIGLPPSPEDMQRWMSRITLSGRSTSLDQTAVADLIDHLLEQPQYGERWGRHWMDVARFAESTGGDQNNTFLHAWRYRDWIIDAFNADMPYDQFVRTQLAGDLLPIADEREWADNIIGTGFLAVGVKLVGEEDQQKYFADLVDEQIDATTRAFLGMSVACARCHDHKFDPIPQADYYALAGVFRATETHYGLLKAQARQATTLIDLTGMGPEAGTPNLSRDEYAKLIQARDDARTTVEDAMKKIRSGENVFRGTLRRIRSDRDETEAALQAFLGNGQPRVFAMGAQDRDFALPTRLLVRGELDNPAQEVPRGLVKVLSPEGKHTLAKWTTDPAVRREKIAADLGDLSYKSTSGRLELAQWISSRNNPLTARVMVNRIWHWMFGHGIVRTVDDFGSAGDPPSHAKLLDYLAIQFMNEGWSVKKLIREIALSRTWQLASTHNDAAYSSDPGNIYLWRMNRRRLEAEAVRDAMLAVSGKLDLKRPRGTLLREAGEGNVGQNVFEPVIRGLDWDHRSVYLPRVRAVLPEILDLFDAPDAGLVAGSRDSTSSPLQSLYLMNNPWMQKQAVAMSERVSEAPGSERIRRAHQLVLSRDPTKTESEAAIAFMTRISDARMSTDDKLAAYCQALMCTAEFRSID
ncbi:MAG: PSD1 and planctomycete cytochrome C domain-containing protein [Planctomycetaceae bacterium]|nr:PSD1 and planctomycete cytochrome C domain-containing protein [Planctomycetaceae bacterium]